MKTITINSHFKKVTDKSSAKYGEKRDNLEWTFDGLEASDISEMSQDELAKVAVLVNDRLESFGKQLLLKNTSDWTYTPEYHVSISACYNDITAETTRKRTVTKETLAKCGEFYASYAHLIGKSDAAANAGNTVIAQKLRPIAGKPDALGKLASNIVELIEAASDDANNNIKLAEDLETNATCLEWIVAECEKLASENVNIADAL